MPLTRIRRGACLVALWALAFGSAGRLPLSAEVLWSDPDPRVIHKTPDGNDLLGGALHRDDTANDALFFKFQVDPLSDLASEPYFAGFQLFEGDEPRLGVGNAPEAWGYSAFDTAETSTLEGKTGEFDLKSAKPEAAGLGTFKPYELPHHGHPRTIILKVQYVPGGDDLITVWLNPRLTRGATDENQPEILTTKFKANATFNQIRLRHAALRSKDGELKSDAGGNGWIFSDMAVATSFSDFVVVRFWQTWWFILLVASAVLASVAGVVRFFERRKFQQRLQKAEQERALERERGRIAQDLHDDLGSSLARISLLSGLARDDRADPQQVLTHLNKIAQAADETVRALEEIVWAVRPGSDSLQSLVEYIAHFSNELFEGNGTRCRLDLPHDLPQLSLPPELRHNIFLVVKEALTNVVKHAQAKEVHVQAKATADSLEFVVQDDGHGFEPGRNAHESQRNGLSNMQRRAATMGGQLTVESTRTGTAVRLVVPIAAAANEEKSERSR
jgi:signal transduction histidine kinase